MNLLTVLRYHSNFLKTFPSTLPIETHVTQNDVWNGTNKTEEPTRKVLDLRKDTRLNRRRRILFTEVPHLGSHPQIGSGSNWSIRLCSHSVEETQSKTSRHFTIRTCPPTGSRKVQQSTGLSSNPSLKFRDSVFTDFFSLPKRNSYRTLRRVSSS